MTEPVRVRFFASAREAVGRANIPWPVPAQGIAARELVRALVARYPELGPLVAHCRLVRNSEYVATDSENVRPGDEFGLHPPYSGG